MSGTDAGRSQAVWACTCGYQNIGPICTHCGDYRVAVPGCACCGHFPATSTGYCETCNVPFCHADPAETADARRTDG